MRHYLLLCLIPGLVFLSIRQTPSAAPSTVQSASPERKREFGSSLRRYEEKKKRRGSQNERKRDDVGDEEVVRVETDLVVGDVLVTNRKGNLIIGLQKNDFTVTEDGVPQRIEMFSFGRNASVPRSIVLIIDCAPPQAPYLSKSIEAAKVLVDKLAPPDRMAIVTVDLKLRLDFTSDKSRLKETLDYLKKENPWLGLNIEFNTLLAVLNEMFGEEDRQRIVVFQGDGTEIIWLKPDEDSPHPVSHSTLEKSGLRYSGREYLWKIGFSDVKEAIERSRATVYSVIVGRRFLGLSKEERLAQARITVAETSRAFGRSERELPAIVKEYQWAEAERKTAGQAAMFKTAELSGGYADFIERPEDAENVYSNIFTVIENRYLIGYYPTNRNRDGKRREVRIEVRNHPEYTVTGRKAYILSQ